MFYKFFLKGIQLITPTEKKSMVNNRNSSKRALTEDFRFLNYILSLTKET
jgi:hypothetical protein